jgi:CheY-like chemotaxis protein
MSGALTRTHFSPVRRPRRRGPRLGDDERGRADRPGRGGAGEGRRRRLTPEELARQLDFEASGRPVGNAGRVLIVDDEQAIRLVCRVNLANAGFETIEAADGPQAIELARAKQPDLILLDIMLPGLDGWQVAEALAADEKTRDIPIVFLSARSEEGDVRRGHEAGGVGYITKPFDAAALPDVVAHTMARVERGEGQDIRREWLDELEGP